MANNRMRLMCLKCRESTPIAKYFPPFQWSSASEETVQKFFDKHTACFQENDPSTEVMWGTGMFKYLLEVEPPNKNS